MSSSIPCSPVTASIINNSLKSELRPENSSTDSVQPTIMEDLRSQVFQGQLYKFTNVVKGWQYRWFELHPESGQLEYYYYEDHGLHDLVSGKDKNRKIGNKGKKEHIAGAVVVPSEEDSQTFNVNFASGESYKLRAPNVKERQIWVDRIRAVSQLHDRAIAHSNPPVPRNPIIMHRNQYSPSVQRKSMQTNHCKPSCALPNYLLTTLDTLGSMHEALYQANVRYETFYDAILKLPMPPNPERMKLSKQYNDGPFCDDTEFLLIRATSHAVLSSIEECLRLYQQVVEIQRTKLCFNRKHQNKSLRHRSKDEPATISAIDT